MSEFEVIVFTHDGKVFLDFQSAKIDIEVLNDIITVKDKKGQARFVRASRFSLYDKT